MKGDPGLDSDDDFVVFCAVDIPDPLEVAEGMWLLARPLARALLDARARPGGDRRVRLAWNDPTVAALRSLGMVEVAGFTPTESAIRTGAGTFLTGYGEVVRQYLCRFDQIARRQREAAE